MLDPLRVEALGDHNDSSLSVEAQGHLGAALVVLSPNRHKELILQQGGTFYVHPGCISGGANWTVANNHDVMFTTELQKFGLREIWMALNLVGHRFVFEAGFVEQQLQLSVIKVGDAKRFDQPGVFTGL